jgi:hypothetical protein
VTRAQQEATWELAQAQGKWLRAYGWRPVDVSARDPRWAHRYAPKAKESYTTSDALALTRAEPLRYGGPS